MDELVERCAEEAWQAESRRAGGRDRLIPWSEEHPNVQEAWRHTIRAIIPIVQADQRERDADLNDARQDNAYYQGAKQYAMIAGQSEEAAQKWLLDGCAGRAGSLATAIRKGDA